MKVVMKKAMQLGLNYCWLLPRRVVDCPDEIAEEWFTRGIAGPVEAPAAAAPVPAAKKERAVRVRRGETR